MATSSVGDSSGKQYLRCKNAYCIHHKVARIKVSQTDANPNRLFVCCDHDECDFFRWFKPMKDAEVNSDGGSKMAATDTTTSLMHSACIFAEYAFCKMRNAEAECLLCRMHSSAECILLLQKSAECIFAKTED
ncbi:putative transcription factor GRF family [Senna tora]|uniref:Putative transcription factor GRF family n=1 Tax=Senna tora TaxID=362788 RepID=A0A834W4L0_9FABA|nr:putative transcription factor GRF family [Senna tora]